MKKKLFSLFLVLVASVGTTFAVKVQIGDLYYNLDAANQTAEVTSQNSSYPYWSTTITTANIPASVTYNSVSYSVTSIGDDAFCECSRLTSVTIGNSVTSIGDKAFVGCSSLSSPVYNAHVFAFMPTSYSGAFTIPDGIESIAGGAFHGCSSLTSVTIPNSVTSIGNWAFAYCSGLASVTIPNSVTSIGDEAFYHCSGLTSVTIPNSVTSIGYKAFLGCTSLSSVTIPNSVTSIGEYAFAGCTGLTSPVYNAHVFAFMPTSYSGAFTIPDGIESIAGGAFSGCSSLTSVTIPNSVTSIGNWAFAYCSGLASVTIPNSVTSIGGYGAFINCTGLTSVTIPNSVTSIEEYAFLGCTGLTSVTIPNSVTSIGREAFSGCSSLTSITIPNSVTSIGFWSFYNCSGLTSVTIEAETPPTLDESAFSNTHCSIYVPCGTLDSYKTAEGWSDYASLIRYAPYSSYNINKKAENGHITTSSTDIFTMCDTEHPVICTANPDRGFYFVRWADGNTENPRTIELSQDTTMEAIFDYLLTGKCGKDSALTWTFEPASMALNITGKGALSENYTYGAFIESLTIGNEITSIGEYAFSSCNNLKNVIIGSSVKVLEQGAFAYCSSIETITCYSMRPPTVNTDALYGLDYSTIVYVPADYLNTYQMHDAWGLYDVRPLGAKGTETTDVNVTPAENTAEVAWPAISGAATYELVIKDKSGNVICTLVFNANGQLTQIAFGAPARNNAPQQTQAAGFSFTVTGLENGTSYDLTITSKDNSGTTLDTKTISFTTSGKSVPTDIDEVPSDQVQCTKVIREGQIFILRGDKTYTLTGQETIMP